MPACTRGCRVLTRPSRHSGKPVSSSTLVTGTPAAAIRAGGGAGGDELDARLVQAAREVLQPGLVVDADQRAADRALRCRRCAHGILDLPSLQCDSRCGPDAPRHRRAAALDFLDALVQSGLVVVVADLDHALGDDRAGVDAVVDEVDGAAGDLGAVRERVAHPWAPGKTAAARDGC